MGLDATADFRARFECRPARQDAGCYGVPRVQEKLELDRRAGLVACHHAYHSCGVAPCGVASWTQPQVQDLCSPCNVHKKTTQTSCSEWFGAKLGIGHRRRCAPGPPRALQRCQQSTSAPCNSLLSPVGTQILGRTWSHRSTVGLLPAISQTGMGYAIARDQHSLSASNRSIYASAEADLPVVDRKYLNTGFLAEVARDLVCQIWVAKDVPSTVDVQQSGERASARCLLRKRTNSW
eukprot:GHVR01066230.1.p1 GENE.GHVR01066230.1~~GHVR01066230.1.p1  ORF type:complete len:236 (+),score=8.42 GHVR01066230.1:824-1531(+)